MQQAVDITRKALSSLGKPSGERKMTRGHPKGAYSAGKYAWQMLFPTARPAACMHSSTGRGHRGRPCQQRLDTRFWTCLSHHALLPLLTLADAAADAAADALVQKALQAGTSDNVTALLMLIDWQH